MSGGVGYDGDRHAQVIAASADLGFDVGADDGLAFLLREMQREVVGDGSPCPPATAARHAEAHRVPRSSPCVHAGRPLWHSTLITQVS
jgi:hypothetical protein